jgi:MFS family permease
VPVAPSTTPPALDAQRWKALAFISIAQLMVVLDATIVNIALPQAQADLQFSDANRQWVITAYSLAFGGLLIAGGRLGDMWGRKRVFLTGLIGFALASALGGAAVNTGMLLGPGRCRACSLRCSPPPRCPWSRSPFPTGGSGRRRSGSSVPSPVAAARWACCSAVC